jgi:type IV pilus assembly protein PilA
MTPTKLKQVFSWLLNGVVLIAVIGILASIAIPDCTPSSHCGNYLIRSRVTEGLALAASAKTAVAENAANGAAFNNGWTPPNATSNVSSKAVPTEADRTTNAYTGVVINPTNGVITITYTDKVQTGSPFILLIPVTDKKTLPVSGESLKGQITWECHSASAPANDVMLNLLGTLNPKYAPSADCRR